VIPTDGNEPKYNGGKKHEGGDGINCSHKKDRCNRFLKRKTVLFKGRKWTYLSGGGEGGERMREKKTFGIMTFNLSHIRLKQYLWWGQNSGGEAGGG